MNTTLNGATELRSFNKILPSEPVMFPFGGDYAEAGVIYNQGRVQSWYLHKDEILGGLERQYRKLRRDGRAADKAYNERWAKRDEHKQILHDEQGNIIYDESLEGYEDAVDEQVELVSNGWIELGKIASAIRQRKISYLVIGFVWPYADPPDPQDQEEMEETFDEQALNWMVSDETLLEVAQQIGNPKEKRTNPPA
jgi:hypothetical protein